MTLAYTLCEKPALGLVLWLASMCVRPPLVGPEPIALAASGSRIDIPFKAPAVRKFELLVNFAFATPAAALADRKAGESYHDNCTLLAEGVPDGRGVYLGRPMPFRVTVRDAVTGNIVHDARMVSVCRTSHGGNEVTRRIGSLGLVPGSYVLTVINLEAQPGLETVRTTILLAG